MTTTTFIAGGTALLAFTAALFFLRFWRDTRDRFFALFAVAFALFGVGRIMITAVHSEHDAWLYGPRLAAFVLIIVAIGDKNRS